MRSQQREPRLIARRRRPMTPVAQVGKKRAGRLMMRRSVPSMNPRPPPLDGRRRPGRNRKRWATSTSGRRPILWWCQGLFFLSVFFYLPESIVAGVPGSRPSGESRTYRAQDGAPQLTPCMMRRPFVCFAYDALNKPYPKFPPNEIPEKTQKCEKCQLPNKVCGSETWMSQADFRPASMFPCSPNFCKEGQPDNCIKPVDINGQKVYFPMNVCTREMIAKGECPLDKLSTVAFSPGSMESTNEYVVQCDAGFTVPGVVKEAKAKNSKIVPTCIPSLHMAAGYLTIDDSPLKNYKYDVAGPQVDYCAHGGRKEGDRCHPLPLCGPNGKAPELDHLSPEWRTEDCDKACAYPSADGKYDDCVILDIRMDEKTVISYRRLLSGPYAQLMSNDENLLVSSAKPPVSSKTQAARMKRAGFDGIVRYPRCIDAEGLSESHKAIVLKDTLLNCATNPVYLAQNKDPKLRLTLQECASIGDATGTGEKFCRLHAPPTTPPTTSAPVASSSTLDDGYAWILITVAMCLIQ